MSDCTRFEHQFTVTDRSSKVSAILLRPERARWLLVFGHGAGAGMNHSFMNAVSEELSRQRLATFRYQFPYMEQRSGRPDPPAVLVATVRAAVLAASEAAPDLALIAGGKSLGGRMTSTAASQSPLPGVQGLVFFGFPLHPAGQPSTERAKHLHSVNTPMLFLQGTRDKLAELDLLRPVCSGLGDRAELRLIEGADHSFHVLKRSGRTDRDVLEELGTVVAEWAAQLGNQSTSRKL
ncbi:MAG: alpha/beta hydrolase [Acidobacteria bacterium]|nr:alpha/beta hydrolase [Acidobacteriota bacterium]